MLAPDTRRPMMRRVYSVGSGVALVVVLVLARCGRSESDAADLVFRGGTVRTMDDEQPLASAVAVRAGRIVYVGDEEGVDPLVGPGTEVVELEGRLLLPGFHDTHAHPLSGGVEQGDCDLHAAESRAELLNLIGECAARAPEAPWVRGGGYQATLFPGGAPTRELLDSLVPDRPAYLADATEHTAWVNSRALAIAGVDVATAEPPPDGVIVRRPDGSPQGTLREAAMALVARHVPPHGDADLRAGLGRGLELAASVGVTTIHEAGADEPFLRAYSETEREGRLTARVVVAMLVEPSGGGSEVERLSSLRARYETRLVRPTAAKIFLDGVIEGGTAAVLEPYIDREGWRGELRVEADALSTLVAALDSARFKVHMHAIGDRAVRTALDVLERQRTRDGGAGPRHVIAHLQLVDASDFGRFEALGVVASFQPLWAQRDSYITDLTEPRLGPERSARLYPMKSMLTSGATIAAGSDWPVTSMNPLEAIEVAITRRNEQAGAGDAWIPEERLSLEEVVRAYTVGGALAGDMEAETGSIAVGKSADLVVLDRDVFTIDAPEISDVRVEMTVLEGRVVYRRPPR